MEITHPGKIMFSDEGLTRPPEREGRSITHVICEDTGAPVATPIDSNEHSHEYTVRTFFNFQDQNAIPGKTCIVMPSRSSNPNIGSRT